MKVENHICNDDKRFNFRLCVQPPPSFIIHHSSSRQRLLLYQRINQIKEKKQILISQNKTKNDDNVLSKNDQACSNLACQRVMDRRTMQFRLLNDHDQTSLSIFSSLIISFSVFCQQMTPPITQALISIIHLVLLLFKLMILVIIANGVIKIIIINANKYVKRK